MSYSGTGSDTSGAASPPGMNDACGVNPTDRVGLRVGHHHLEALLLDQS